MAYRSLVLSTRLLSAYLLRLKDWLLAVGVLLLKDWLSWAYSLSFGLRLGGWCLGGGVCVSRSLCVRTGSGAVAPASGNKLALYPLGVGSVVLVLCQFAYTLPVGVAVPCFASGHLLGVHSIASLSPLPAHTLTDPHPHNFGVKPYIHPTLTQTTFSPFKNTCPSGQYTNKETI